MASKKVLKVRERVLIPEDVDFKYQLGEGASDVTSNDKRFEMNFDLSDFARKDVKVKISKRGINISAFTETEEETAEFNHDLEIPPRALPETITCQMNRRGVLRISAPLTPEIVQTTTKLVSESMTTTMVEKKSEKSSETYSATSSGFVSDTSSDDLKSPVEDAEGNVTHVPKKLNFTVEESKIKEKPEFIPGRGKFLEAYMKCTQYTAEEIKCKVNKVRNTIRIEGKHESKIKTESRSFFKECSIPSGVKPEEIEFAMNSSGILRIMVESKEIVQAVDQVKEKIKWSEIPKDAEIIAPTPANFEAPPAETTNETITFKALDKKTVQMYVNTSEYKSEEVRVVRMRKSIRVEAKRVTQQENREFFREIALPRSVLESSVKCEVNQKGILRFTASTTASSSESYTTIIKPKIESSAVLTTTTSQDAAGGPLQMSIVAEGYNPEELSVAIKDGWITVKGKKQGSVFGGETSFRTRSFTKKIEIPPGIKPESIIFSLDSESGAMNVSSP